MKTYVLDAGALIRYLAAGPGEEKVAVLIQRATKGEVQLFISVINWGEALYSLARKVGLSKAKADLKSMSSCVSTVEADEMQTEAAAIVRLHYRLAYADCFAAALAISMNASLVTTDADFAKLGKQLKLIALPN